MGGIDRVARIVIAGIIAAMYFNHFITGTLGLVLLVVAGVFAVTGFVSVCPLYLPFGISTRGKSK